MSSGLKVSLPTIASTEGFDAVVSKLGKYISKKITTPLSFEELRSTHYARTLYPLVKHLVDNVHHPATVHALLALKGHFGALESEDDRGITATRGIACELVAWRFVTHLNERDALDYLCTDLAEDKLPRHAEGLEAVVDEQSPLLGSREDQPEDDQPDGANISGSFSSDYHNLNALEIAVVTQSKKFLGQRAVQRIIDGIWKGDIMFWQTMSPRAIKQASHYRPQKVDPFTRLRVPLYLKCFEVMFFAAFLAFYYTVLVERSFHAVTVTEVTLYVWLAAFTYNELGEMYDAGLAFYAADFWAIWDLGIIATGISFFICRMIGLRTNDHVILDTAFDILSVEALFLVRQNMLPSEPPSVLRYPTPMLEGDDFIKFLGLVFVLYLGFNTTFGFLARGTFSFREMNWILIKVFFGSSYLGFDVAEKVTDNSFDGHHTDSNDVKGFSNTWTWFDAGILLEKVMEHARDEYLFVYSVFVLEASTSNRLTLFIPPLNLLPLLLRPLRLFVAPDNLRACRITLLKATHWPLVALILTYENCRRLFQHWNRARGSMISAMLTGSPPSLMQRQASGRSIEPQCPTDTPESGFGDQEIAAAAEQVSSRTSAKAPTSEERLKTLEALATSLKSQLHTVEMLIESEKAQGCSPEA
ncbi:hypothetical protein Q7P37_006707 [Cladosporium fusiforme]